ncbi:MAG: DoxX family membrane protein [Planctomycetes bacterium]|nr:DoxX family membrane protein [Planctomycetota bacterium]NQU50402.1 DoxX family membrane protein [Planctomycetota bacterium]
MRLPVLLAARLYAGLMLLIYGIPKLREPADLLKSVNTYGILPNDPPLYLNLAAVGLPWLEVITGAAILTGVLRRGAGFLSAVVLVVFTSAILMRTFAVMSADQIGFSEVAFDCGCGSGVVIIWQKMIFNGSLIVACLLACMQLRKPIQPLQS